MCKQGHKFGLKLKAKMSGSEDVEEPPLDDDKNVLDADGVWASRFGLLHKSRRLFVHYHCALHSPLAWFNGVSWMNLQREINRGTSFKCKLCDKTGATIGCIDKRCNFVMHVPCAAKCGFTMGEGRRLAFSCPQHQQQFQLKELEQDLSVRNHLSRGHEPTPVTISNALDSANLMNDTKTFQYTAQLLDSNDVMLSQPDVGGLECCACEGRCDDVATCACLAGGKSYTYSGALIPNIKHRILECNLRCNCSVR